MRLSHETENCLWSWTRQSTFITRAISAFWKTHSLKLIPNWTQNRMITYTSFLTMFRKVIFCFIAYIYNNYSMSPRRIWSDKITNERVARVGYNHFISNKGEWNNCLRVRSFGAIRVRISNPRSVCMDHGASKEPANPWPEWIRRFLWCTMIQTDLGSLIRTRITPKERTRRCLWCTMIQTDLGSLIRTRITPKERTLSKFSNRVLPPIFISAILQSENF